MKNKLYTKSYFKKRLRENGIPTKELVSDFSRDGDPRYWMLISEDQFKFIITCIKTDTEYWFDVGYGKENVTSSLKLHTQSIEVVINTLNTLKQYES